MLTSTIQELFHITSTIEYFSYETRQWKSIKCDEDLNYAVQETLNHSQSVIELQVRCD